MLGPSISLGKIFGIPLRLHWTFSLLLLWVFVVNLSIGGSVQSAFGGTLFLVILFGCVTLHELGHCIAAKRFGIATRSITLSPIGGVAALESEPRKWSHELWIALAGPAVNVAICFALLPLLILSPASVADFTHPFASIGGLVAKLFIANLMLAAFNLLPAFPMDGGRVMRALLAARGDFVWATRIAARSGQVFAAAFAIIGLFFAPFMLLIAAFLFFAAEAAYQGACYRAALEGWRVGDLMRHDVATVSPVTTVADAAALSLRTGQDALPLVDGDRVLGLVDREVFARARTEDAFGDPVISRAVMGFRTPQPNTRLSEIVEEMNRCGRASLPVMDGDRLVGMISLSAISDLRTLPIDSSKKVGFPAREATA